MRDPGNDFPHAVVDLTTTHIWRRHVYDDQINIVGICGAAAESRIMQRELEMRNDRVSGERVQLITSKDIGN